MGGAGGGRLGRLVGHADGLGELGASGHEINLLWSFGMRRYDSMTYRCYQFVTKMRQSGANIGSDGVRQKRRICGAPMAATMPE
ncbi:hypothetical protein GCM10009846_18620 [Agrococcus versicolor]|uniref:Uncharacterized protein n=1 Tax=Agrococcus versicolor TaxID=501482 RepID=A0ABN3AS00_9MICO